MLTLLMLKKEFKQFKEIIMQERIVRAVAGTLVLISVLLSIYVNVNWLFLAGFVGVNLIQSSLTKWCLMTDILCKLGVPK